MKHLITGFIVAFSISAAPMISHAQFGGLDKIKDKFSKTKKEADKVKDTVDTVNETRETIETVQDMVKGGSGKLDKLFNDVSLVASAYNQCSDLTISKGKSTVTITGATDNLSGLRKDLPKSDSLRSNTIIEIDKSMCDFVVGIRRIQDPKDKETPSLTGPGRQQVADASVRKPVRLRFDFNEDIKFAQFYYVEWKPDPFVVPLLDLKNAESREDFFGGNNIPLAKGGKSYELKGPDGPITLFGYGPRLIVLVESKKALNLNDESPQKWLTSLKKAQITGNVAVSVSWLELYTPN
jgi:hypothetical protein